MGSVQHRHDEEKSALDMGTVICTVCFEPGEFDKRFIVSPKSDRRTKQGKADEEAFIRDVADMGISVLDGRAVAETGADAR